MMYRFMTLEDGTEVVHSEILNFGGEEKVKVYIEKPIHLGFKSVECYLPDYDWHQEMDYYREVVESLAHIIIELAKEGGFDNASNF